ncbi:mCG146105, partial [Mus musculus]
PAARVAGTYGGSRGAYRTGSNRCRIQIFRVDVATVRMFLNHRQEGTAAIYSSWTWADTRIQELGTVIMSRTHDSQMKQGRSCPSGSADC